MRVCFEDMGVAWTPGDNDITWWYNESQLTGPMFKSNKPGYNVQIASDRDRQPPFIWIFSSRRIER